MGKIHLPPPAFILAAIAAAGILHALISLPKLPGAAQQWITAGMLLVAVGLGLAAWAIAAQLQRGTSPDVWQPTTALVTTGPYAVTRNPIYLGFLLIQAGIGLATGWWLAILAVPASGFALSKWVIQSEETQLATRFEAYEAYCHKVRRWF